MADRRRGCSWIPTTPAKEQLICTNREETQPVQVNSKKEINNVMQVNLPESGRLPGDFVMESKDDNVSACCSSNSANVSVGFNSWKGSGTADSQVYSQVLCNFDTWQAKSSLNDADHLANMSFSDLLALADASANREMGFGNSSIPNTGIILQAGRLDGVNNMPQTLWGGTLIPSTPSEFEPITPDKTTKVDQRQDSTAMQEVLLQESHKPDKEGTDEADLSKTPQQKLRRKKHRPKVIKEGKTKSTPKPSPEKPLVPQENTRVKRKYVRRKGVNNSINTPLEREANETDSHTKAKDTPVSKRKCTSKKAVNKPEVTENVDQVTAENKRSSCRRSLNFDSESQIRDESTVYGPSSKCNIESQAENCSKEDQSRTVEYREDKVVIMEKNDTGTSNGIIQSKFQEVDDYLSKADRSQNDCLPHDQSVSVKGKCKIVFSDVTNDKEMNTVQVKWTPKITSDSSSSSLLTPEKQSECLKSQHVYKTAEAEQESKDTAEAVYSSIPTRDFIFSQSTDKNNGSPVMYFPTIYKRKETGKRFNTTSNLQDSNVKVGGEIDSFAQLFPSSKNQGSLFLQCQATNMPAGNPDYTQDGRQVFEDLMALGPRKRIKKMNSKSPTQVQDLTGILQMRKDAKNSKNGKKTGEHAHEEAVISNTSSPIMTKRQPNKSLPMKVQNGYNHHEFPTTSKGKSLVITWECMSTIDSIVDQLNQLNLNAETSQVWAQNKNAIVEQHMHYQTQCAIVPYQRGGAVVPFNVSFDQVRRKRQRPKVELDDETTRVWKLLLENINSEGIDGTDEENSKWWDEERRVFNGRADSFIARMHLVQGDRRFSPWKGSVVDSVVGVFLTQNVSDHLSSSAFMSLAARFPLEAKTIPAELHEASVSTKINEPEVYILDSEDTFGLNKKTVLEPDTKLHHNIEDDDIREVNSTNSFGNSFGNEIPKESLRDMSQCSPVISHESDSNKLTSLNGDGRDMDEAVSSQTSVISSQNSADSLIAQTTERAESSQLGHSEDPSASVGPKRFTSSKLLQMAGTELHGVYDNKEESDGSQRVKPESSPMHSQIEYSLNGSTIASETNICSKSASCPTPNLGTAEISGLSVESVSQATMKFTFVSSKELPHNDQIGINPEVVGKQMNQVPDCPRNFMDVTGSNSNIDISRKSEHDEVHCKNGPVHCTVETVNGPKSKGEKIGKDKQSPVDWDGLRKEALKGGVKKERTANAMDSVDWEAVRCADVSEIAEAVKERGMNNKLAERIQDFLNRIVRDHGSVDLEWLRNVPPDKAKEYLLSVRGLGLKSVECVRLLTLHQLAFPVDTNVGRIAVRLGWVPLQPLPESLQLHLLEMYPVLESIQKYLWPRLCKLDQRTLYELHYQMITFGKVFCTKSRPNCNACPMRGECRHFASAFASARLALPAPADKSIVSAAEDKPGQNPMRATNTLQLLSPQTNHMAIKSGVSNSGPIIEEPKTPEPIIEMPATPEQIPECDIEDTFYEDPDEIPTIQLNMEQFTRNLHKVMQQNSELQEGNMSNALVALAAEAASIPVPKLKNVNRLRTEHQVYELPDSHPLLQGVEQREPDDPSPYLLAIWTPGETVNSIEPPEKRCSSQESEKLCTDETCSSCNSIRELNSQTVRGTLLIPCRTAMRGSFPLNGTYFQVNEVFSDHESSLAPIDVPREWLWNLPRRIVYFGTSVPTIFKGLTTEQIQYCFWRGFVCVRGFDRSTRAPRPLIARLHFPASKLAKGKGKTAEN